MLVGCCPEIRTQASVSQSPRLGGDGSLLVDLCNIGNLFPIRGLERPLYRLKGGKEKKFAC